MGGFFWVGFLLPTLLRGLPRLPEAHRAHLLQVRHERAGPEGGQARGQQGDLAPGKNLRNFYVKCIIWYRSLIRFLNIQTR